MTRPRSIAAVVLAGGEGQRMGGGKPLRMLEGRPLIEHALAIARGQGGRVAVAVQSPGQVGPLRDVAWLADPPEVRGPLAGLVSALAFAEAHGEEVVLTLPCDAPRLPADLGRRLLDGLGPRDQAAVAQSHGRLHPVCAVWRVAVRPVLDAYLASGRASVKGLAELAGMAVVDWGPASPDPFVNLNTLDELAAAERAGLHA